MPQQGKPYKFTPYKQRKFLKLIEEGHSRGVAASQVGVSRQCVSAHARKHPGFAMKLEIAEEMAISEVEAALYQTAIDGNVKAQILWLCNRCPDRWKIRSHL